MQTGWFVPQCITRGAYKLSVTELEVATLAFATLTTVIYAFWWYKPLDVSRAVPIEPKSPQTDAEKLDSARTSTHSVEEIVPGSQTPCSPTTSDSIRPMSDPPSQTQQNSRLFNTPWSGSTFCDTRHAFYFFLPSATTFGCTSSRATRFSLHARASDGCTPYEVEAGQPKAGAPTSTASSLQATSARRTRYERFSGHVRHFRAFFRHQRHKRGLTVALFYAFVFYLLRFFLEPFEDMLECAELESDNPLRVPTFYAPTVIDDDNDGLSYATAIMVTFVFGGIHCIQLPSCSSLPHLPIS
ncbi:unnamed protein product [Cyclocybe aegerita]|uniref:Uncharacterized protein n=1 Tax=Cyclocybe aegerita TaxID=1973307 RepID=A0A8S0XQE8_CYCAE|nr:unnamed protein product [Cyclocybe aegerita]